MADLEKLRRIRNGVTHAFGRATDDYDSLRETQPRPFTKVSEEFLKKTLGLEDRIAVAVDAHLGPTHIGEYEALYFYHHWDKQFASGHLTEAQALAKRIGALQSRTRHISYYRDLIAHHKAA